MSVESLREHVENLSTSLARWAVRDDTRPQPEVRRAANSAVEAIDAAIRDLHAMRGSLVAEIRQSDDAAMARTEALLARQVTR